MVLVHFAAEHPAEFQLLEDCAQAFDLGGDIVDSALIFFGSSHFQQVTGIAQAAGHLIQGLDDLGQGGTLAAQVLGVLGVAPDAWVFELAVDFDQALMLLIVVKDTPE